QWRGFFTRLERLHGLDHLSPHHLWLLHHLFLDEINFDSREFQAEWNFHPLGGTRNKGQSPADIRHGVDEDQPGVHPTILEGFYGVAEDLDYEWEDINDFIAADQSHDVRHAAVDVPSNDSPFEPELEAVFFQALDEVKAQNMIPASFDLNIDTYPLCESIHLGRGGKRVSVTLPLDIWWPRALLWVQALDLMTWMLVEGEL
ncbi:hypothetical protein DFH07DRAFT_760786, partial [Mycena maculata]